MKKLVTILILSLLSIVCAFGFAACDSGNVSGGDETHTHVYDTIAITKQSTCTEEGEIMATCACGATYTAKLPALGHDYKTKTTAPTCAEQGYTTYTCSRCGDSYIDDETGKLPHTPTAAVENVINATCTETGSYDSVVYCSVCGEEISREEKIIPVTVHSPAVAVEKNRVEPTCTETGSYDSVVYCSVCGEEISRENKTIPAFGHNYNSVITAPTCTEQGYTTYTCSRCGDSYIDDETDALGHNYEWTRTKQPTATEKGEETGVCSRCGDTITREIPELDHEHNYTETVIPPTCTAKGYTLHKCACGDSYITDETEKLPHNTATSAVENIINATCTTSGSYDSVLYCSVCGEEISRENKTIPALGHNYRAVTTTPTCTEQGYTTYTCSRCGDSYIADETEKLPHTPAVAVEENRVEPTCTETGNYDSVVYCAVCGEEISREANTIPAIGTHNYVDGVCTRCGALQPTDDGYFTFTLLSDDTYEIKAKDRNNIPAKVVLPSAHDNKPITSIGELAFAWCYGLTSIVIPDSVTSIGEYAFYGCSSLTSINVSAYNRNYKSIDGNLFSYDGKTLIQYAIGKTATTFTIPDSVTSIGECAFSGCSSLTSIVIPDGVTSIGDQAFSGCSSLTSITIGNSVTSIGDWAFYDCSSLTSITIGNSVTSIGYESFYGCSSLTSITIGNSVKSIGDWAFGGCSSLTSVTIGNGVTSIGASAFSACSGLKSVTIGNSVTSIGDSAFFSCSSLTSIVIPDSVTSIGEGAFQFCSSLTSITIPDSVTSIGDGAFSECYSLTSIVIPDSVTSIGDWAFAYCYGLTSITIGNSVTSIGDWAFGNCENLTTVYYGGTAESWNNITIDNDWNDDLINATKYYYSKNYPAEFEENTYWHYVDGVPTVWEEQAITATPDEYFTFTLLSDDTYEIKARDRNNIPAKVVLPSTYNDKPVTSIGNYAFERCRSLTSITIPDSVISIENYAFYNCSGLASVTIPDSVTSIGYEAFRFCSSLTSITIGNSVTSIGNLAFHFCSSLTSIDIPDSVTSIGTHVFAHCSSLTSITIPDSVTSIGDWEFSECSSLTSVTIGNSVTSIGYGAFSSCSSLTSINVSANNTNYKSIDGNLYSKDGKTLIQYAIGKTATTFTIPDSVTNIGYEAFYGCSSLTSIDIPDSVTSIGDSAFFGCSRLTSINVSANNMNYKSIDGNLYSKDGKTLIQYAKGKTATAFTIPDSVTSIRYAAFYDCSSLTSITIGNSVTSIGNYAFSDCSSLTSITIGNSVTSIGEGAFEDCSSLTSIVIPDSVTSIGDHAFEYCSSLTSITIPDSVTSIGDCAFWGCSSLTSITFNGTKAQWGAIEKGINWKFDVPATVVKCTDGDAAI